MSMNGENALRRIEAMHDLRWVAEQLAEPHKAARGAHRGLDAVRFVMDRAIAALSVPPQPAENDKTLRDYFATEAMAAGHGFSPFSEMFDARAEAAYKMADAMLRERNKSSVVGEMPLGWEGD